MKGISQRRSFLMGIAIILIMFCHNTVRWPYYTELWKVFSQFAQCGVDIFLLLSGYGLFYSYQKKGGLFFLKKRLKRIIPTYLIISGAYIFFIYLMGGDLWQTIWDYSLVSFFLEGNLRVWFIAAILLLYLLFPLIYHIAKHDGATLGTIIVIWGVVLGIAFCSNISVLNRINSIFIVRIPVFILGAAAARKEQQQEQIGNKRAVGISIMMLIVLSLLSIFFLYRQITNFWTIVRILFCPISILLCFVICHLPMRQTTRRYEIIHWLGGITLEVYLLHESILKWTQVFIMKIIHEPMIASIFSNIFAAAASIIAAYCFSKIVKLFFGNYRAKSLAG